MLPLTQIFKNFFCLYCLHYLFLSFFVSLYINEVNL
uniref:Uncharacterized protein n=1 Tax=Brugia timori TaxID=42155 RepID=A0A0R3RBN3_9BILA